MMRTRWRCHCTAIARRTLSQHLLRIEIFEQGLEAASPEGLIGEIEPTLSHCEEGSSDARITCTAGELQTVGRRRSELSRTIARHWVHRRPVYLDICLGAASCSSG